jgi:hypothetical protein
MKHPQETPPPVQPPRQWLRRISGDTIGGKAGPAVSVFVDGQATAVRPGDSVAAAVLLAGHAIYRRTVIDKAPRAPFCMMGVCFECLVEIDGIPNQQGCMVMVREGMKISRQLGLRSWEGSGHDGTV